jgi:hypothetical protein
VQHDPQGYGVLNTFSESYNFDAGSTLCGTLGGTAGDDGISASFAGHTTCTIPFGFSASGFYTSPGTCGVYIINPTLGGQRVCNTYGLSVLSY